MSACSLLTAYKTYQVVVESNRAGKLEAFLFAHAVPWRRNPTQNCSFFTPTTALSPEITFEKPEVNVPCLPAELSQNYTP